MKSKRSERGYFSIFSSIHRNRIISLTANLFRSIIATTPDDLLPTVYLLINQVAPSYEGLELGIGDGIIIKAIQEATGKSSYSFFSGFIHSASIKSELKKHGDLGDVAMTCKSTQRLLFPPPPLTVRGLFKDFLSLAQLEVVFPLFSFSRVTAPRVGKWASSSASSSPPTAPKSSF